MNSEFVLRISTDKENYDILSSVLNVIPTSTREYWELSIKEVSAKDYPLTYLASLIENNIQHLNRNGIRNEDITIWYLYEYDGQCNMEFHPAELKKLGDNGIVLCISCWPS